MVRGIVGFVVGIVVWMPVFFVLSGLGNLIWPEYGMHVDRWFDQNMFTFPPPMAAYNVACWAAAAMVAGSTAAAVGRRRQVAWLLAAAIGLYMCAMHLIVYWPTFPWWYNLGVALPAAPAVLLGGLLARRPVSPAVAR
jgi:hypothetical protein